MVAGKMLAIILNLLLIVQGGLATFDFNQALLGKSLAAGLCTKRDWWNPCLGCSSFRPRSVSPLMGRLRGDFCPSIASSSFASPKYLPFLSATTSQVPVFKSYFKPVVKTHYKQIPFFHYKVKNILKNLPCLKKKIIYPGLASMASAKKCWLKGCCSRPSLWGQPCSPYSTFC